MQKIHQKMKTFSKYLAAIIVVVTAFLMSCSSKLDNMIDINGNVHFTIYPNSIEYQELNAVGGWAYVTGETFSNSRGVIVYRFQQDEFMAYDRHPLSIEGSCDSYRLEVNLPFVVDNCNDQKYNILNGFNINGDGTHLYWYQTVFDGTALTIHN